MIKLRTRLAGSACLVLLFVSASMAGDSEELKVTVHLRTGAKLEGIVRSGLEVLDHGSFRPVSEATSPSAGYRIWYSTGTNGFIFVHHRDIVRMENRGAVTDEQRKRLDEALRKLRDVAEQGRRQAREQLTALKQRQEAEVQEEEASEERKTEEAEREKADAEARRRKEIIERFSPPEWIPDRRERIQRNQTVLGLPPSAEEQQWLDSYDLWKQAYDEWKKQEAEKAKETGAEKPVSRTPEPTGGGAGERS